MIGMAVGFSPRALSADVVSYPLGLSLQIDVVYPSSSWLPTPYKSDYKDLDVAQVIELFTTNSLHRDGIGFDSVTVHPAQYETPYVVEIRSDDASAKDYSTVHPRFVDNYARAQWSTMTGVRNAALNSGITKVSGSTLEVPFILGNHPDLTTYQCCPNDPSAECQASNDLIEYEQVDVQIACWLELLASGSETDPGQALAKCKSLWVTNRSPEDDLTFCTLARMDSNECFGKNIDLQTAEPYCRNNNNNPCASPQCPVSES